MPLADVQVQADSLVEFFFLWIRPQHRFQQSCRGLIVVPLERFQSALVQRDRLEIGRAPWGGRGRRGARLRGGRGSGFRGRRGPAFACAGRGAILLSCYFRVGFRFRPLLRHGPEVQDNRTGGGRTVPEGHQTVKLLAVANWTQNPPHLSFNQFLASLDGGIHVVRRPAIPASEPRNRFAAPEFVLFGQHTKF